MNETGVMHRGTFAILLTIMLLLAGYEEVRCGDAPSAVQGSYGSAQTGRYAEASVLASGDWVKVRVSETGMHKVTYEQMVDMGIANPMNVRVYGYGGGVLEEDFEKRYVDDLPVVPTVMVMGADGVFGKGDYIVFYAQGPVSWQYNTARKAMEHKNNPYSLYGYYFITSSRGAAEAMPYKSRPAATEEEVIEVYDYRYLHETDRVNVLSSGKVFFNEEFTLTKPTHTFDVSVPDMVAGEEAQVRIHAAHQASSTERIAVSINGVAAGTVNMAGLSGNNEMEDATVTIPFTPQSGDIRLSMTYSTTKQTAHLDYFAISAKRRLRKEAAAPLAFRYTDKIGSGSGYCTYKISGTSESTVVWDVTDLDSIMAVEAVYEGGATTIVEPTDVYREYVAFDPEGDRLPSPVVVGRVANQNLHALSQADMVIIAPSEFVSEAQRLADAHRVTDGMTVNVVEAGTVYNEFSSGTPDATAYRRLMKMLYDRAASEDLAPKYLLLFGDGSFDNRQLLKSNTDKDVYRLLTYQSDNSYSEVASYCTDDYFGFLDDNEGSNIAAAVMDIAVGRIPAYTVEQAKAVVDKTIRYMENDDPGAWKNQAIFLADDGDGNSHIEGADTVCNLTRELYPSMLTRKLYFDSYKQESSASGASYPTLKKEFFDYVNSGVLMINYMGHGGYNGWADERILGMEDVPEMYNERLPLWVTATCNFSRFDHFLESTGEMLLTHADGGAIGLVSTSRTVLSHQNNLINLAFTQEILRERDGELNTVGEALMRAKNKRAAVSDINRLSFVYLGDPAVRLNYPTTHTVTVDTINGHDVTSGTDTIGALGLTVIKGRVADRAGDGAADETFNGYVEVKVFDKMQSITTLCNDAGSSPFTYTYRSNPIYSGKASVTEGRFEIQFIVPKDIKYNFGSGEIILYAADEEQGLEGNGHCNSVIVGGESPDIVWESEGPQIRMYLNSPDFTDGSEVNENPLFVAHVSDQNGINTIGTGFGHDIILKIDNSAQQEYVLNSYYESVYGTYNEGYIHYQLNDLPEGKHSLFFRVWDMQNNSSSATLNFEVVKGLAPKVNNLYVYPNPVSDAANIVVENDRPNQPSEIYIYIYDYTGRMVWTYNGRYVTDTDNRVVIPWRTSDCQAIVDGIYMVRAIMIDANGEKAKKATKILVRR